MQQISKEYLVLFNAITNAEKALHDVMADLLLSQQVAEELYVNSETRSCSRQNDPECHKCVCW